MRVQRSGDQVACTYCGARGGAGTLLEADLRGVRYDYCDAACAMAHRQVVELTEVLCGGCDEPSAGDSGVCDEHFVEPDEAAPVHPWRKAG